MYPSLPLLFPYLISFSPYYLSALNKLYILHICLIIVCLFTNIISTKGLFLFWVFTVWLKTQEQYLAQSQSSVYVLKEKAHGCSHKQAVRLEEWPNKSPLDSAERIEVTPFISPSRTREIAMNLCFVLSLTTVTCQSSEYNYNNSGGLSFQKVQD